MLTVLLIAFGAMAVALVTSAAIDHRTSHSGIHNRPPAGLPWGPV